MLVWDSAQVHCSVVPVASCQCYQCRERRRTSDRGRIKRGFNFWLYPLPPNHYQRYPANDHAHIKLFEGFTFLGNLLEGRLAFLRRFLFILRDLFIKLIFFFFFAATNTTTTYYCYYYLLHSTIYYYYYSLLALLHTHVPYLAHTFAFTSSSTSSTSISTSASASSSSSSASLLLLLLYCFCFYTYIVLLYPTTYLCCLLATTTEHELTTTYTTTLPPLPPAIYYPTTTRLCLIFWNLPSFLPSFRTNTSVANDKQRPTV